MIVVKHYFSKGSRKCKKFRKKPVVIEAVQYTGSASPTIFIYGLINKIDIETEEQANEIISECERNGGINISTLEDIMLVSKGDWVIKGVKGEYYPCKPDIFEATYKQI